MDETTLDETKLMDFVGQAVGDVGAMLGGAMVVASHAPGETIVKQGELGDRLFVLYEGEDMVALASEEMAIRAVIDHEIETYDPYESTVMVWTR